MRRTRQSVGNSAVGYARVSSEEQSLHGVSLAAQEESIRAYCTMRRLTLAEMVTDAAVSGGIPMSERPGGRRVAELVESGAVGSVVALKLDRLFRDCADCLTVTKAWDRRGVALHLIDLGGTSLCTNSAMGTFFLTVMAGAAELERNLIRERTVFSLAHKKARGERVGGIPYGYRLSSDGVHLEELSPEQETIALIRDLRQAGHSLAHITERLNAEAVPARGSRWHIMTVHRLLARAK